MRFGTAWPRLAALLALSALGVTLVVGAWAHPTMSERITAAAALPSLGGGTRQPNLYDGMGCSAKPTLSSTTSGRDFLCGSSRSETFTAGPADVVMAGGGNDTIYAKNNATNKIDGGDGNDWAKVDQDLDTVINVERRKYNGIRRRSVQAIDNSLAATTCPAPETADKDDWAFLGPECFPLKRPTVKCNGASLNVVSPPQLAAADATPGVVDWQYVAWTMLLFKWNATRKQWDLVDQTPWYWDEVYDLFDAGADEPPENFWRLFDPARDDRAVNIPAQVVPLPDRGYYTVGFKEHWYAAAATPPLAALSEGSWNSAIFTAVANKYAVPQDASGTYFNAPYCRTDTTLPPLVFPDVGHSFANVNADPKAEAIKVGTRTDTAASWTGNGFQNADDWTHGPYHGSRGTWFADVTGDGKADAIAVDDDTVSVRPSTGKSFGSVQDWTHGPYYAPSSGSMDFADVTGDRKADAIVVGDTGITVRRSTGTGFSAVENWTQGPYRGSHGTYFADVNGDGRADAIAVDADAVHVRLSNGSSFGPVQSWTNSPYDPVGTRGMAFADVNGDRKADAIVVNDTAVTVRLSSGSTFLPGQAWTSGPYYGSEGTFFADVNGDGKADAIVVNGGLATARLSTGSGFASGA